MEHVLLSICLIFALFVIVVAASMWAIRHR